MEKYLVRAQELKSAVEDNYEHSTDIQDGELMDWLIEQSKKVEHLEETVRIYKVVDEYVKEQSKKVKHLFPLENTAGYGQLCDMVLKLSEEKSFFVKVYAEKVMAKD